MIKYLLGNVINVKSAVGVKIDFLYRNNSMGTKNEEALKIHFTTK